MSTPITDEKSFIDPPSPVSSSSFDSSRSDYDVKESLLEDIEAQSPRIVKSAGTSGAEYEVATRTKLMYLGGYFLLNLGLTIYNKAILGSVCIVILHEHRTHLTQLSSISHGY